jgi:uncharacterized protein (DUF433 family)
MAKGKLNLKRFFDNIEREGLKNRLNYAKQNAIQTKNPTIVDILFSGRDGKYDISILEDFGIKLDDVEDTQALFISYFGEIKDKLQEFIASWYDLEGFELDLKESKVQSGDILLVLMLKTVENEGEKQEIASEN